MAALRRLRLIHTVFMPRRLAVRRLTALPRP